MPRGYKYNNVTFREKVRQLAGNEYTFLGKFENVKTHMNCLCNRCKVSFPITPMKFIEGRRCAECYYESLRLSKDQLQQRFDDKFPGEFTLVGPYTGVDYKTKILHKLCNTEFEVQPNNITSNGQYCPICSNKISSGEYLIKQTLENMNIQFTRNKRFSDCVNIQQLPFDFFIENLNIAIEYDGEQHFRPVELFGGQEYFEKLKLHDEIKTTYCEKVGIDLLRIPFTDKNNIKNIIYSKLTQRSTTIPDTGVGSSDPKCKEPH